MSSMSEKWLVAVSGGPDSMALLDIVRRQGIEIGVAHINYHTRDTSNDEEAYVRSYCEEYEIPCFVRNETYTYSGNFEAWAREYRYTFFQKIVEKYGYQGILVGHQEDDVLETYFMQEEKEIEPAYYGLKEENIIHGILVKRPLLNYTKKQLETYCLEHSIRYFIDSSNADVSYTRNRIRHEE